MDKSNIKADNSTSERCGPIEKMRREIYGAKHNNLRCADRQYKNGYRYAPKQTLLI